MIMLTDTKGYTVLVDDDPGAIAYVTWDPKEERSLIAFHNSELLVYVQETPEQIQALLLGEIEVDDEGEHSCADCLYEDQSLESLPCRDCQYGGGEHDHWEPADILDQIGLPGTKPEPGPLERAYDSIPGHLPQVFGPVVTLPLKR